jgi:hypothetical protein
MIFFSSFKMTQLKVLKAAEHPYRSPVKEGVRVHFHGQAGRANQN